MRRRLALVLILASVVGLLTSIMVYRVLSGIARQERAETIVVASVNMGMAETITSQHVRLVAWPKASIPSGAVRSLAEAEGRVVRGSIVAGEPLLDGKLAPELSGKGGLRCGDPMDHRSRGHRVAAGRGYGRATPPDRVEGSCGARSR